MMFDNLSESFEGLLWVFFLLGGGIMHSIEKATQLVHGTPRLAASHRTFQFSIKVTVWPWYWRGWEVLDSPFVHGMSAE